MSSWQRVGGVNSGVHGTLIQEFSDGPNVYKDIYRGVLASPGFPGDIPTPFPQGMSEALRSALGHYGENDLQFGVAMQEVKQTAGLVGKYYTEAAKGAGKLFDAVDKKASVRKSFKDFFKKGWKAAPSVYLEYLFGVAPLADDVQNAMLVLSDTLAKGNEFILTLRGNFSGQDTVSNGSWYSPDAGPLNNVIADFVTQQRNRAVLRFLLPSWFKETLPPVTPFRQAYQTTSMSFVLDWILPVGSWLAGFEGLQLRPFFHEGCVTEKLVRRVSGARWSSPGWVFVPERSGGVDNSYVRIAFETFPTERIFTLPRLKPILGLTQLRVGAALLAQRLAGIQTRVRL
jgi:hypothetical protein